MKTEITENKSELRGEIFYDAECPICCRWVKRCRKPLEKRGFQFIPLQTEVAQCHLGLVAGEPAEEMKVITCDERILGGVDAIIHLAKFVWWMWPLFVLAQIPGAHLLLRKAYRWLAKNRYCLGGQCSIGGQNENHPRH